MKRQTTFWTLTGYEYKKMLGRRGSVIALLVTLAVLLLSTQADRFSGYYIDGVYSGSSRAVALQDRDYARALAGRPLDAALLGEMASAYAAIPETDGAYQATPEYQNNARPYAAIRRLALRVYDVEPANLTPAQAEAFYDTYRAMMEKEIEALVTSDAVKAALLEDVGQIATPWVFASTAGYENFLSYLITAGAAAGFLIAVLLAQLFSGEYASGADQLLLAAKTGKRQLIGAKLFAGFTVSAGLWCGAAGLVWLLAMLTFGFDGADAPFQLIVTDAPYPLTVGRVAAALCVIGLFGSLLFAALVMWLSARLRTPFGVILLSMLLLFLPMVFSVPSQPLLWQQLYQLLPTGMMVYGAYNLGPVPYALFGAVLPQYLFLPLFAAVAAALLTPFAAWGFRRHQIT